MTPSTPDLILYYLVTCIIEHNIDRLVFLACGNTLLGRLCSLRKCIAVNSSSFWCYRKPIWYLTMLCLISKNIILWTHRLNWAVWATIDLDVISNVFKEWVRTGSKKIIRFSPFLLTKVGTPHLLNPLLFYYDCNFPSFQVKDWCFQNVIVPLFVILSVLLWE